VIIELKPEHQQILNRAIQSGLSQEEALDQAFTLLAGQFQNEEWLVANAEEIRAQIERGFTQSERGELVDGDEAVRILRERRAKRNVA
jgi:hemoglobin-like flavoprotein